MNTKALFLLLTLFSSIAFAQKINVSYTNAPQQSFTGKVYLYLSKENKSPKEGMVGIELFPVFAITVKDVKPGQKVAFDDKAIAYPVALSDLERGKYYVQAVWDRNLGGRAISQSPGNSYNEAVQLTFTKDTKAVFNIECDQLLKELPFVETQSLKEIKAPSKLLTDFYKRPTSVDGAVMLPKEYHTQPNRKFPVLYIIGGFGNDYHNFSGRDMPGKPIDTTACITVFLGANCPEGHAAYANSDNNGPWGDAMVKELIPAIEKQYRTNNARLLTGHSSGGWTVLWLQTQYPEVFAGCWSSSPDPVDFRNFQMINIYSDTNTFYDKDGQQRMVATVAGRFPWATMKNIFSMENVISRGEQMHSFDAVFSTRTADGTPRRLCNPSTGAIDPVTVEHWKKYDISFNLRTNWKQLQPSLQQKIRVSVGEQDNFLLNHAVHLLDDEMKKLNAGFVFTYYPGDHFTVHTPEYVKAGNEFLQARYKDYLNKK